MRKVALITGINGMDAHYLNAHLTRDGYEVHGIGTGRKSTVMDCVYHQGNIRDTCSMPHILGSVKPTHIFNLAAQSNVAKSLEFSGETTETNALGAVNMLRAYKQCCPEARFFQASSSEMFGISNNHYNYKDEDTPMVPITPYGLSKLYAHKMCGFYRDSFKLPISCGIMFNHTSELQSNEFLIPKVINTAIAIQMGKATELKVGNIEVQRDWGHSSDYTQAMKMMLEQDVPDDFAICTGRAFSVEYLIKCIFESLDLDYTKYIVQDPALMRHVDQPCVIGSYSKARKILKWEPTRTFEQIIREMVMDKYNK